MAEELEGTEDYRLLYVDHSMYVLTPRDKHKHAPDFEVGFKDDEEQGITDDLLIRILIHRMDQHNQAYPRWQYHCINTLLRNALDYLEQVNA